MYNNAEYHEVRKKNTRNINVIVNLEITGKNSDNVRTISFIDYYTISDNKTFTISYSELVLFRSVEHHFCGQEKKEMKSTFTYTKFM